LPCDDARVEHGVEPARGEPASDGRDANGPGASSALTETELRVVELVASGLSDRAIASLLSLSPTAVEANLGRVYCKLGITTRAALTADRPADQLTMSAVAATSNTRCPSGAASTTIVSPSV
jgi:DNA-binding CsgD family transcriptional regulator